MQRPKFQPQQLSKLAPMNARWWFLGPVWSAAKSGPDEITAWNKTRQYFIIFMWSSFGGLRLLLCLRCLVSWTASDQCRTSDQWRPATEWRHWTLPLLQQTRQTCCQGSEFQHLHFTAQCRPLSNFFISIPIWNDVALGFLKTVAPRSDPHLKMKINYEIHS